ncbi:MAG: hypothetical protein AAFO06_24760 [Cyanobacteria bacterium J06597_16]
MSRQDPLAFIECLPVSAYRQLSISKGYCFQAGGVSSRGLTLLMIKMFLLEMLCLWIG